MGNERTPDEPAVEDDATPVAVPPYEDAPSSTGLVLETDDDSADDPVQ